MSNPNRHEELSFEVEMKALEQAIDAFKALAVDPRASERAMQYLVSRFTPQLLFVVRRRTRV